MQIQRSTPLPPTKDDFATTDAIKGYMARLHTAIAQAFLVLLDGFNHKIEFDNFLKYEYTSTDTGTANTEFTVSHNLGFVPGKYILTKINNAGVIYDSGTTWTTTQIFLKCSTANAAVTLTVMR